MKPGRELDREIAEHVMGWTVRRYSTDIAAAWEVVEEVMPKLGYHTITLLIEHSEAPEDESVMVEFGIGVLKVNAEWGISVPHAICLAALKAVGVPLTPEE
jgi:hypothetical protein